METMNISLPDPLRRFVDKQIASGRYSSASEYVRELIRFDEKRRAQERLEGLLLEGLGTPSGEMTARDWSELKKTSAGKRGKRAVR
ncbi:MAG: type II toxin-antitoxin system ParD family antitoxin [Elusimicrobia bacterium]|nr:type II toxin-antitoxin system ParD family antitoxin [Elusimicrobiota bacterium]